MRRVSSTRGMTLVELLAAMAIFLGLAGMVLQVLGGGLDLWASGERTRDESEQASALLDRISAELRHSLAVDGGEGEPRVKMLCDFIARDSDGDGQRDFRAQRLLFVRSLFEERTSVALSKAGTTSGSPIAFTGAIDVNNSDFMATEGRTEVAFLPLPDERPGFEGRMVLWRALRSPIGAPPDGKQSLFSIALRDEGGLDGAALEPLAENVLWFGLSFIDESVHDLSLAPDGGGPLVLWDSTRALLPRGEGYTGFRHARGPSSLADADDDVFPDAVGIAVVMIAPPGEAPVAEIAGDVPSGTSGCRVELRNGRFLQKLGPAARIVKIGQEWVETAATDGQTLVVVKRGLYGTSPAPHLDGSKVLVGRRFERIVPLPAARADLISRDLEKPRR